LSDAGRALIEAANAAGGKDNITVVLLRLEDVRTPAAAERDGHTTATELAAMLPAGAAAGGEPIDPPAPDQVAAATPPDTAPAALPVTPRVPRRPPRALGPSRGDRLRRRARRLRAPLVALVVLGALIAGAYLALQSVYFVGTNQRGLVTLFRGIPYELPGGIRLYSSDYVSGVSASTLPPERRQALLDHSWRSESDAADLVRQLELGQLSGG
jgi:protein phosphatase